MVLGLLGSLLGIVLLIFWKQRIVLDLFKKQLGELHYSLQQAEIAKSSNDETISFLKFILESISDGVLVVNENEMIQYANKSFMGFIRSDETILGKPLVEVVRSQLLADLMQKVKLKETGNSTEIEMGFVLPRRFIINVQTLPFMEQERNIFVLFHDVTELRKLESIKTDFVANVSHELRTPIASIRASVETLQTSQNISNSAVAEQFIQIIDRNVSRLQDLVNDLLDLSKIESPQYKLTLTHLNISEVIRDTLKLLTPKVILKKHQLTFQNADQDIYAIGNRRAIEQILVNLIDNAIQYTGKPSSIEVIVREKDSHVVVIVQDNGEGISPMYLERIFERFFRISRDPGGTGLGLTIVKHLVECMDGKIEVQSQMGEGVRFSILLQRH